MDGQKICIIYLAAVNVIAFFLMGADKRRAKRGLWRVPEATLMLSAVLGGGPGALAGMRVFRHKTRKKKFTVGIPLILAAQLALSIALRTL